MLLDTIARDSTRLQDRIRSGSAEALAAALGTGAVMTVKPGTWTSVHEPSTATKATTTKTAVAGKRHICTSIHATIACDSTVQTPLRIELKDDTTVVAAWSVAAPANGMGGVALDNLCIPGTVNKDMTLTFSAAGVTGSSQTVTLGGFDAE